MTATFRNDPGGTAAALGKVTSFRERIEATRFSPFHSERSRAVNVVSMSGRFVVDPSDDLAARRTALFTAKNAMQGQVNGKQGILIYTKPGGGDVFSQTVRVKSFDATVDQAVNGIDWTLEVEYTAFPNESTFGTVDYDVDEKQGRADGQLTVTFSGKVQSPTKVLAESALGTVRSTVLGGYSVTVLEDQSSTENAVCADDGSVFVEMTFSETYLAFESQAPAIKSVAFGYSISQDPVRAIKRVRVSGSVFGSHQLLMDCQNEVADNFLGKFIASLSLVSADGRLLQRAVAIDHEYIPSTFTENSSPLTNPQADRAQKLDFTFEYEDALTPAESILECEVTEEVQYSGDRLRVHAIPGGPSVAQNTGTEAGSRRVSGSVVALTYSAAESYAQGKRSLLTGFGSPLVNLPQPERLTTTYEFRPLTSGVADGVREGGATNVRVVRMRFEYSEILLDYPPL